MMGIWQRTALYTDEALREEISRVEAYLRESPEPGPIRGKSYVRRWGEECKKELARRAEEQN